MSVDNDPGNVQMTAAQAEAEDLEALVKDVREWADTTASIFGEGGASQILHKMANLLHKLYHENQRLKGSLKSYPEALTRVSTLCNQQDEEIGRLNAELDTEREKLLRSDRCLARLAVEMHKHRPTIAAVFDGGAWELAEKLVRLFDDPALASTDPPESSQQTGKP